MQHPPWTDEDLERIRRSTRHAVARLPLGVDRATALALLEELQSNRRTITHLQAIVEQIAQLVTPTAGRHRRRGPADRRRRRAALDLDDLTKPALRAAAQS